MPTIKTFSRRVYGNQMHYILDRDQAQAFRDLTGQKTITPEQARALVKLTQVEFEQVADPQSPVLGQ